MRREARGDDTETDATFAFGGMGGDVGGGGGGSSKIPVPQKIRSDHRSKDRGERSAYREARKEITELRATNANKEAEVRVRERVDGGKWGRKWRRSGRGITCVHGWWGDRERVRR